MIIGFRHVVLGRMSWQRTMQFNSVVEAIQNNEVRVLDNYCFEYGISPNDTNEFTWHDPHVLRYCDGEMCEVDFVLLG